MNNPNVWIISSKQETQCNSTFQLILEEQQVKTRSKKFRLLRSTYYRGLITAYGKYHVPQNWLDWAELP